MKKIGIASAFLAFLLSNQIKAQEKITLSEAIQYALENKADAKKARLNVENAENKIMEAKAGALPNISATGALNYNPKLQTSVINMTLPDGTSNVISIQMGQRWQGNAAIGLNQQIFNQTVFTGLKAAKTTREFYQINAALTDEQIIEKVANSYYDVYKSQLELNTINSNLESTSKTKNIIEGLFNNGLSKKIDLDRVVVAIGNLNAAKQQLQNAIELKENALKFVIGMDINKPLKLADNSFETADIAQVYEPVNVEHRTELQLLNKQAELLTLNKAAEKSKYYPTLALTSNYGYLTMGQQFPLFSGSDKVTVSNFIGIGLSLNVPIFNGFLTKAKVRQAQNQIDELKVDIEDTKLGLSLAAENAKVQVRNSLISIHDQKSNMKLAQEVLDNTNNNYKLGLANLTELLDAEKANADAKNNYSTALLNYKIAEIQLIKANGNLKSLITEKK